MRGDVDIKKFFWLNVFAISISEFFWGLGLPIILESTFVPLFLTETGATNFQIGLTGSIFNISIAIFPFISAYFASKLEYKKAINVWLQVIPSVAIMLLGLSYIIYTGSRYIYSTFIFFYSLFSIGIALSFPVWQNYVVKIFAPEDSIKGMSFMMISQNVAKVVSGFLLLFFITHYGINKGSAGIIFLFSGFVFLVGSLCFFLTKEQKDNIASFFDHTPLKFLYITLRNILKNKDIIFFFLQDIEFTIICVVAVFYGKYAVEWTGISASVIGGKFVIIMFIGAVTANLILGFTKKYNVRIKYLLIKLSSILSLILLISSKSLINFYAISFLIGFSKSGRFNLYGPVVKWLAHTEDASAYYAMLSFLMLPISVGLPAVSGLVLDLLKNFEDKSYIFLFGIFLILTISTLFSFFKIDFKSMQDKENK
ncbi:MAG: MFS transporter [Brevinematia bacterium]